MCLVLFLYLLHNTCVLFYIIHVEQIGERIDSVEQPMKITDQAIFVARELTCI